MTTQMDTAEEQLNVTGYLKQLILRLGITQMHRRRREQEERELRDQVVAVVPPGGTWVIVDPRNPDRKLLQATVSKTSWVAKVTERWRTEKWVVDEYPAKARREWRLKPHFTQADAMKALFDLAPKMFEEVDYVEDHVIRELELKSQLAGEPVGFGGEIGEHAPPGITVTKPDSKVVVTVPEDAYDAFGELIVSGFIDMDGNIITPSAEAA